MKFHRLTHFKSRCKVSYYEVPVDFLVSMQIDVSQFSSSLSTF